MCRLDTERVEYQWCTHLELKRVTGKQDCGSPTCRLSQRHPSNCPYCPYNPCKEEFLSDRSSTIVERREAFCDNCAKYYQRRGA